MSNNLVIYPVLLPFITAVLMVLLYKNLKAQKVLGAVSSTMGVVLAVYLGSVVVNDGIQVFHAGDWIPPFGIALVADMFSVLMLSFSSVVALACLLYSYKAIDHGREKHFYYAFFQMLLVGVYGSFLTGDLFNMFVFFEVMLIASYVLIVLGGELGQLRESFKYVLINSVSSVLFLVALSMLYSVTGTLNMADAAVRIAEIGNQGIISVIAVMFMIVFGLKASVFPLYFWLPNSYFQPPTVVSALFGGILTKVGVYALIRVFTLIFIVDVGYTHTIILVIAGLTMAIGILGPVCQMDFKLILVYHIISQVGYMIMGLGLFTAVAIAGAIFHILHNIIVKSCLILISGVTEKVTGTTDLKKMGGLLGKYPLIGWSFFFAGLALAGVPPLSGFFSKFVLIKGGLAIGSYPIVAVALVVSVLTLFSMMKIFIYAFWGEEKEVPAETRDYNYKQLMPPVLALIGVAVVMGLGAEWIMQYIMMAADQLMTPEIYINSVLIK
ncbi:MAG: Na+/H+ antiporter subunit D [Bacillota bacterium]